MTRSELDAVVGAWLLAVPGPFLPHAPQFDGVVAVSDELLVSIINARGTRLGLVVLNACHTAETASAILLGCPSIHSVVFWSTLVHSEAANFFAVAFAEALDHGPGKTTMRTAARRIPCQ